MKEILMEDEYGRKKIDGWGGIGLMKVSDEKLMTGSQGETPKYSGVKPRRGIPGYDNNKNHTVTLSKLSAN